MLSDNLPKINIADLKVGDKVYIAYQTMVGWRSFRYPTFKEYTVERITPKKTKVYLTNGVSAIEVNPAKTHFYQDCLELQRQNCIANCAQDCHHLIFELDQTKDDIRQLDDNELLELHGYLASALEILQKTSP